MRCAMLLLTYNKCNGIPCSACASSDEVLQALFLLFGERSRICAMHLLSSGFLWIRRLGRETRESHPCSRIPCVVINFRQPLTSLQSIPLVDSTQSFKTQSFSGFIFSQELNPALFQSGRDPAKAPPQDTAKWCFSYLPLRKLHSRDPPEIALARVLLLCARITRSAMHVLSSKGKLSRFI